MRRFLFVFFMIVLLSGTFGHSLISARAAGLRTAEATRYYTSIYIREGDSLWSIAARFRQNSPFTIPEYIEELKRMNGLEQETIYAGQYLTVVYFE